MKMRAGDGGGGGGGGSSSNNNNYALSSTFQRENYFIIRFTLPGFKNVTFMHGIL
jgi:hypothetical protein